MNNIYKEIFFITVGISLVINVNGQWIQNNSNIYYNTGNVGIGIAAPDYKLQVQKTNSLPAFMVGGGFAGSPRIQTYGLDADPNAWMGLGTDMSGKSYEHSIYFPNANGIGRLTLGSYNGSTYDTKLTLLENGNIGLGVINPNYKFSIEGIVGPGSNIRNDGGYGGIDFSDNGIGYPYSAKIFTFRSPSEYYGFTNDYGNGSSGQLSILSSDNVAFFKTGNKTALMYLNRDGKLGIGTSNLYAAKLQVDGVASGDIGGSIFITNSASASVGNIARLGFDLIGFDDIIPTASIDGKLSNTDGTSDLIFNAYDGNSVATYEKMRILGINGNILINKKSQTNSAYKLDVAGKIRADEITVNTTGADFVFQPSYKLISLPELETYIKTHQHLPDIAPAAQMQEEGVSVSEMQTKLLQKVEELTLYMIEQEKAKAELKRKIAEQEKKNAELEQKLAELEKKFKMQ